MTKAEERALEAYPIRIDPTACDCDLNEEARGIYQFGYKQAEKDLALTWEDMQLIWQILDIMSEECKRSNREWAYGSKSYFTEVLKRFKEAKKGVL